MLCVAPCCRCLPCAGGLHYDEPHRPVRQCSARTTAANRAVLLEQGGTEQQQQQQATAQPSQAAAGSATVLSSSVEPPPPPQLLGPAISAVNLLAMSMPGTDADTAFAGACNAAKALLLRAVTESSDSAEHAAVIKAGLVELHQAVAAGSEPPGNLVLQLLRSLRAVAACLGCSNNSEQKGGSMDLLAVAGPCAATMHEGTAAVAPEQQQQQQQGAGSKRTAHASITASSSSKKAKLQERPPPADADSRPGLWLPGNFYVQLGDTVFMQVSGPAAAKDRCSFIVNTSSSSGCGSTAGGDSSSSSNAAEALCWIWRLEAFTASTVSARFYYNASRSLHAPLLFQKKSQPLQREGLQGVVHTLLPGDVLAELGPELAAEVEELLFQAVDEGED